MSLENVAAFYEKLATDLDFCQQIKDASSEPERWQIVQSAGFDFTPEEYSEFTAENFDLHADEMRDLDLAEMSAVVGGITRSIWPRMILLYGSPLPRYLDL